MLGYIRSCCFQSSVPTYSLLIDGFGQLNRERFSQLVVLVRYERFFVTVRAKSVVHSATAVFASFHATTSASTSSGPKAFRQKALSM